MAQDPLKPKDDGKIRLPSTDAAMNKIAPDLDGGGRGTKDDDKDAAKARREAKRDEAEILTRMRKRFDRCVSAESEMRKRMLDDIKFKAGEQWPSDVIANRSADRRPMLTINKIPTFVHQITNDQRQNRPGINVNAVGDKGDPEAAKMYRGMIRAIERDSSADIAYDTAFDAAASAGIGYWRILTDYESDDTFDQIIHIRRIRNQFTVYLDPDRIEPDGADARFGFVTEMIPRDEFESHYPDADPVQWTQQGIGEELKNWVDQKTIRVAEYYEIKREMRDLVALENGHVGYYDDLADEIKQAIADGRMEVLNRRQAECIKQTWYKATCKEILDSREWPGKWVPIVQVIGDEIDIQGKVMFSGIIRNAKDPQRMYNYWSTAETEMIALAPKAPFIMEEGQVEGHSRTWQQANTKSFPYLLYKGTSVSGKQAPPPQRQPFTGAPQGIVQAKMGAAQDMMATTGIRFDATQQERMQDESGRAIRELRRSGDLGSFHYVDNLARSLKHTGRILIDLIPHIYDTPRMITILREDDGEEQVKVDPHMGKPYQESRGQDGKTLKAFNPKAGKYGVTVTIGPSYATKRIEAAESMMNFARSMPQTAQLIADLIAKNQDWPGADEMARRLAKAVPPNLLTPDQKDIPPQVQAIMQSMEQQIKQLSQERQQLLKQIADTSADRAVMQDKVNKDFEGRLLGVMQKAEEAQSKRAEADAERMLKAVELIAKTSPGAATPGLPVAGTGQQSLE